MVKPLDLLPASGVHVSLRMICFAISYFTVRSAGDFLQSEEKPMRGRKHCNEMAWVAGSGRMVGSPEVARSRPHESSNEKPPLGWRPRRRR
jgi:hypothetical protein